MILMFARLHMLLVQAMAVLAALILATIVTLICADVVLRNVGWGNLSWAVELSEYGLYAVTFLAAPWVLAMRAHVSMDLVLRVPNPNFRRAVQWIAYAFGLVICLILAWKGLDVVLTSKARGSMVWKTFVFPEWWFLSLFPVTMLMLAIGFIRLQIEIMTDSKPAQ
jgi:TRAP-type C4-dicarboxylate transport system permease small subunit